jgi:hypothetical protein
MCVVPCSWHQTGAPACTCIKAALLYTDGEHVTPLTVEIAVHSHRTECGVGGGHAAGVHDGLQVPDALLQALCEDLRICMHTCMRVQAFFALQIML